MNENRQFKLYNILLPLWLLLFWPSWLWLVLIPANYLIDRFVLWWGLGDLPEKGIFCRKHTWKICLAGFFSDLVGACILFAVFMLTSFIGEGSSMAGLLEDLGYGVGFNPFAGIPGFLAVALAVAVSGALIFLLDRRILRKAGLDETRARTAALRLAIFTAPYLYFFPSELLYQGGL